MDLLEKGRVIYPRPSPGVQGFDERVAQLKARVYLETLRPNDALPYQEESVRLSRSLFGERSLRTLESLSNLAIIKAQLGRVREAIADQEQVLQRMQAVLGPEHPAVATVMNDLATFYEQDGDVARSLELGQKVLDIRLRAFGTDHPSVVISHFNLAVTLDTLDRLDEAEKHYLEAAAIGARILSPSSQELGYLYNNMCYHYRTRGRYDDAVRYGLLSLRVHESDPAQETNAGLTASLLASVYLEMKRDPEALEMAEKAEAIARKLNAPNLLSVGRLLLKKGEALLGMGRVDDAERALREAEPLLKANEKPDSSFIQKCKDLLEEVRRRKRV
jgi:tetratricopeptide (TPR) repeat protein